jgi:hypothetical protein
MPGGPKKTKAELDADIKKYKRGDGSRKGRPEALWPRHVYRQAVLSDPTQKALNAALDKTDNVGADHARSTSRWTRSGPLLGMKEKPEPKAVMKHRQRHRLQHTGDKPSRRTAPSS